MKKLLIIGARGYGRGVCDIARSMPGYGKDFSIKGFLDDKSDALDGYNGYPPIIDSVEHYIIQDGDIFACALGDVKFKMKYAQLILNKGGKFINIIHRNVHVGSNCRIGNGCIIANGAYLDCDTNIGDFVTIQNNATIGHDTIIGDWSMIDSNTFTGGFTKIGCNVTIHTAATIIPKMSIGDNAVVNVGSVVIRRVKENTIVMGNPAKPLVFPTIK